MGQKGSELYRQDNILQPLEGGVTRSFDGLFASREKTLKRFIADAIQNRQEFLSRMFPSLIVTGAEHPKLVGGVLYMMGLVSRYVPDGSPAVNSIARRFAERQATKRQPEMADIVHKINTENESGSSSLTRESVAPSVLTGKQQAVLTQESDRLRLTKELYTFERRYVPVLVESKGKRINLGQNAGLVSVLNGESKTGKCMVFLCSSGGDPPGAESFAVEYARRTGNKVVILGQPDASSGDMTQEFADYVFRDTNPPAVDLFRRFPVPSYDAHTAFFRSMIESVLPPGSRFDLYSHSGGTIPAKNLLNDPAFYGRVNNAVFLNPAGVSDISPHFPFFLRLGPVIRQFFHLLRDFPKIVRMTREKDIRQDAKTPAYRFKDAVTRAFQNGTQYRQKGWDTMKVGTNGRIVLFVGGNDTLTGGKNFASYMTHALERKSNESSRLILEYDRHAHHVTPFTQPERVLATVLTDLAGLAH